MLVRTFTPLAILAAVLCGCRPQGADSSAELAQAAKELKEAAQELKEQNKASAQRLDKLAELLDKNATAAQALAQAIQAERAAQEEQAARRAAQHEAERQFARAERLADAGEFFEAGRLLQQLALGQPDTPQGREAAEQLHNWGIEDLLGDDANRDRANAAVRKRQQGWRMLDQAWSDLEQGRTEAGLKAFQELAAEYADSPAGREAEEALRGHRVPKGKLDAPTIARVAREVAAGRLVARAYRLMQAEAYGEAVAVFRKLAKEYAHTADGQDAQDILMECGAWEVEITDANRAKIFERLKRIHREHENEDD